MDIHEFDAAGYHFKLKRNIGPGPYLYHGKNGQERRAESGDFLIMEGDDVIGDLPAHIGDAMMLPADVKISMERSVPRPNGGTDVVKKLVMEVGPGEKFDGTRVLDKNNNPVEGKNIGVIPPEPPSDLLDNEGNIKSKETLEEEAAIKRMAVDSPANRFNEPARKAAEEVAFNAEQRAANYEEVKSQLEMVQEQRTKGAQVPMSDAMGVTKPQEATGNNEGLGAGKTIPEGDALSPEETDRRQLELGGETNLGESDDLKGFPEGS